MNMSIYNILEDLRANSSRLKKEAILKENSNNTVLQQVCFLALHPYIQFYQRKIPKYTPAKRNQADTLSSVLDSLAPLYNRTVTGGAAIEYLTKLLSSLTEEDAKVLECVIRKDLDCGVQESTVNKVFNDIIPSYPCMLASAYDQKLVDAVKYPAIVQVKMDGMRFNAIVKNGSVQYRSRNGKEIIINNSKLNKEYIELAKKLGIDEVVFDGELVVVDAAGKLLDRKTGNGILNKAVKGTISDAECERIRSTLWDFIPYQFFVVGVYQEKYAERFSKLSKAINDAGVVLVSLVESKTVKSAAEAQKLFEKYYSEGQEGIILKTSDGIWEDKRSKSQIKFKGELECDLLCVGWEEGSGKYAGMLGALVLQSADAKVNVSVGTGFTDEMRSSLTPKLVKGKIVTVKYNARINNKKGEDSLFLPVFLEVREDKEEADHSSKIK